MHGLRKIAFLGCLLALVVATATELGAEEKDVKISGAVQTTDGKTLSNITVIIKYSPSRVFRRTPFVEVMEVKAISDARGKFSMKLPAGACGMSVRVGVPHNNPMRFWSITPGPQELRLMGLRVGKALELDIRMKAGSATLSGKVTNDAGKPTAGAVVSISHGISGMGGRGGPQVLSATTDQRGVYRFRSLLPGSHGIVSVTGPRESGLIPLPSSWRGHGSVQVITGRATTRDFSLNKGCAISGRVVDENGKPIAKVSVSASLAPAAIDGPTMRQRSGNFSDTVKTDTTGRYVLEGLTPETYQVVARPPIDLDLAPSHPLIGLKLDANRTAPAQDIVLSQAGSLEGTVKGADGKPVANVTVQYGKWSVRTDVKGHYRFGGLPTGVFKMKLLLPGQSVWAPRSAERVVCVAKVALLRDWILAEGGTVSGSVLGEDGMPIPNAMVYTGFDGNRYMTRTDEHGQYRLTGLVENFGVDYKKRPRQYGLSAIPPSDSTYRAGSVKFDIKLRQKLRRDITLRMGGAVRGNVTGPDGELVAGARIEVFKKVGRGGRSYFGGAGPGPGGGLRTDAEGSFVVRQIPPGTVSVSAIPPGNVNLLGEVHHKVGIAAGDTTTVKLTLKVGGAVSGKITDSTGKTLGGAQVSINYKSRRRLNDRRGSRQITTDKDGRYEFVGLSGGQYQLDVRVFDGRHIVAPQDVNVQTGNRMEINPRAVRGAFIDVKVKDPAGKPLENVSVRASEQSSRGVSAYGRTNRTGQASIGPLLPGTYTLTIKAPRTKDKTFKQATVQDVKVQAGRRVRRDIKLEEGVKTTPEPRKLGRGKGGGVR